jgi:glycosyltransferase involved in cell wall biosynthesis
VQDEQTPVVLAAGDPPEAVDAPTALLSIGMVRETGRPVRLLISPRAEGLRRAARIAAEAGRAELLAVPPLAEQPWRSLPGVDLVLAMNAGLSTAWGMAGAKPIAAPATPGLRHQLTDDKTAQLGPPGKEGELARRVIQLLEQPERSRQLADRARQEAARRYDPARYAERMHAVYTALLENRPLPEAIPPPGSHANPDPTPVSRDPHATDPPDPRHEPPRAESAAQNRAP